MSQLFRALRQDEVGAILSAELVLIGTLLVLGVLVGLVELQDAVVNELNDLGEAIGSINQSFSYHGASSHGRRGLKAFSAGSAFFDHRDDCDGNECDITCDRPVPEAPKGGGRHH